VWALTLLAEMAQRRGDAAIAEKRYKRALALAPRDSYLLGAYADFLLDQKRHADVTWPLLGEPDPHRRLLLRRALALQQLAGQRQRLPADVKPNLRPASRRRAARRHRAPTRAGAL
jgi:hypothetical protein